MTTNSVFHGKSVIITGGIGFIESNLARTLVGLGADVTIADSLVPEYGGNPFNVADFRSRVSLNICDVRDPFAMTYLLAGKDYLFNLAGQTSHLDSMTDPQTDLGINATAQLSMRIGTSNRQSEPSLPISMRFGPPARLRAEPPPGE
jgi:dTDP-glucose 4,6-dehydratase/UDP-glucose 4-epimerase